MRSPMTSQALGRIRPSHDGAPLDAALVVEHLTKRFGERVAFNDVSFEVGYGEVFGFLGPNGAGKTTTVRTLGTLLAADLGISDGGGHRVASRERTGHPVVHLDHAGVARVVPTSHGAGEPGVLRRALRARRRSRPHRTSAAGGQP